MLRSLKPLLQLSAIVLEIVSNAANRLRHFSAQLNLFRHLVGYPILGARCHRTFRTCSLDSAGKLPRNIARPKQTGMKLSMRNRREAPDGNGHAYVRNLVAAQGGQALAPIQARDSAR